MHILSPVTDNCPSWKSGRESIILIFKRVQSFKLMSRVPLKQLCITNIIQIIQIIGKVIHFLAKMMIWKSLNLFWAAQINRNSTHGENLILHLKFISQLNCEDERQMALNLELKATWNWPRVLKISDYHSVKLYMFWSKQCSNCTDMTKKYIIEPAHEIMVLITQATSKMSRQSLCCSHTWSMEVAEESDQKSDI